MKLGRTQASSSLPSAVRPVALGHMSFEKFHRVFDAMAEGSERLPDLPTESFSCERFYDEPPRRLR
jgi:hypothetical protein